MTHIDKPMEGFIRITAR